jgi:hypothetical protein
VEVGGTVKEGPGEEATAGGWGAGTGAGSSPQAATRMAAIPNLNKKLRYLDIFSFHSTLKDSCAMPALLQINSFLCKEGTCLH